MPFMSPAVSRVLRPPLKLKDAPPCRLVPLKEPAVNRAVQYQLARKYGEQIALETRPPDAPSRWPTETVCAECKRAIIAYQPSHAIFKSDLRLHVDCWPKYAQKLGEAGGLHRIVMHGQPHVRHPLKRVFNIQNGFKPLYKHEERVEQALIAEASDEKSNLDYTGYKNFQRQARQDRSQRQKDLFVMLRAATKTEGEVVKLFPVPPECKLGIAKPIRGPFCGLHWEVVVEEKRHWFHKQCLLEFFETIDLERAIAFPCPMEGCGIDLMRHKHEPGLARVIQKARGHIDKQIIGGRWNRNAQNEWNQEYRRQIRAGVRNLPQLNAMYRVGSTLGGSRRP